MTQASILVVEDEHIVAKDIATRLQRRGYSVVAVAASASEAINEAGRHRPDLVLMDIMLKGEVDGISAAERIRELYGLPIVFLTAYADDHTLQRAKVTDAFGYILKPFEERELSITIEMALYKHRMEARLRESERWLATMLRSIGDAIIAADTKGAISFMNAAAEQLTGWTLPEASGRQLSEVFQTSFDPGETRNGGTTFLVSRAGDRIPLEESAAPIKNDRDETTGIVVIFRDITLQHRAEEALRMSEARTAGIIASAMDAIITINGEHHIVVFNAAAEQLFRCTAAFAIGKDISMFVPDTFRAMHTTSIDAFGKASVTGRRMGGGQIITGSRADGSSFPMEASISHVETHGEHFFTVIIRDSTERLKAEHDLRESEERYRRFFEDDLTGDFITRIDGTLLDCNPQFARILGFPSVVSAMQCDVLSLYPSSESREMFHDILRQRGRVEEYELDLLRPDGQLIHVVTNAIAMTDGSGQLSGYKGYLYDITERKKLEEQVRQSHKMESIGTLASGIAHDFNNILNNVIGFVQQIKKHAQEPEKVLKYSATIEKSATRGAELSAQLLSFARKAKRENVIVNVTQIVDEVYTLCTETFPRNITVTRQVDESPEAVLGNHGELYQVLLNLCVNARDAILAKGTNTTGSIAIGVFVGRLGDGIRAQMLPSTAERYVEIRVSDDGVGIPESVREKIFDPFFTTKERGQGTGLGLSVVYNIVRNHRGIVMVDSEENKGTTFHVFFAAAHVAAGHSPELVRPRPESVNHETVLIVDDEESMQELGRELLEEKGYSVLIASSGREAIEIFRQQRSIDLVVLDLVMPGMDGGQTYLELKRLQPNIKAFFCTGFMPDQVISALLEEEHLQAIQKPFQPEAFVQMVRDVLDGWT